MSGMRHLALLALVGALVVPAGCGGDDDEGGSATTDGPTAGAVAPGGGLSIEEAVTTAAEPPLAVSGFLVGSGDERRVCSTLRESDPEQCGEPSLRVEGEVDGAEGQRVTVFGAVEDDTLVVDPTVQG
jgi:hypothetical protein